MSKFTVDTHLFRELGELLVGRDSTALVELIKNAYDADATRVTVIGDQLASTANGSIKVIDNGVGMSRAAFEEGFLRIASRAKEAGNRRSPRFGRRYTGEKGIGRLAAHKLARVIEIASSPWQKNGSQGGVDATIDWDEIERHKTLDDLEGTDAVLVSDLPSRSSFGTTITLSRLRRRWNAAERGRFISEIQTFSAPEILVRPAKAAFPSLFGQAAVRDSDRKTEQNTFGVRLEGDFAPGDEYWTAVVNAADWVIEIDALTKKTKVRYQITPTAKTLRSSPDLKSVHASVEHPAPASGPFFQARILVREGPLAGAVASQDAREWIAGFSGIKVFLEGFRVLPYGEKGNDWLSLDFDYAARSRKLPWLEEVKVELPDDSDAGLLVLPNRSHFGAVFLTQSNAAQLKMLVNREGFLPDAAYDTLVRLIRTGVDLGTRTRAAARQEDRQDRRERRAESAAEKAPSSVPITESLKRASSVVTVTRQLLAKGDYAGAKRAMDSGAPDLDRLVSDTEGVSSELSMLRVLASVGTQMAAFIHELNSLLGSAQGIQQSLERVRGDVTLPKHLRQELNKLAKSLGDLRRSLERHASYLVNVVSPDARRRRSRQSLADRFDAAVRLISDPAEKKRITIINALPSELRSPPMFPAEVTTVFSNLLTNAVKAAGDGGIIRATGSILTDGRTRVVVENTGASVKAKDRERWFKPFESTTVSVDPVLGQGMGLGLPITRNMLEQYGAEVRFIDPAKSFSTALEILFPRT